MSFDYSKYPSHPQNLNDEGQSSIAPESTSGGYPSHPPKAMKQQPIENEDIGFLEQSYRDVVGGAITAGEMGFKTIRALPGGEEAGGWKKNEKDTDLSWVSKSINSIDEYRQGHPEYEMYDGDGLARWFH